MTAPDDRAPCVYQALFYPDGPDAQALDAMHKAKQSSARNSLGDAVMSNINGTTDAQRLIFAVRKGCAPADLLLEAFTQVQATGESERLRGFARELQKALERAA